MPVALASRRGKHILSRCLRPGKDADTARLRRPMRSRRLRTDPVVIGATGGSGTRVVVTILQACGVALGTRLNESLDPFVFMRYYDRWIDAFVLDRSGVRPLGSDERSAMRRELGEAVKEHLADAAPARGAPWGWKSPRSIFLLPLLDEVFPQMRFVHVVRDPRDMAFSANQRQVIAHGGVYLSPEERAEPDPIQSALLWKRVNADAAAYGRSSMPGRYLLLRFEDLCADPAGTSTELASFVGAATEPDRIRDAAASVSPPASVGRWRQEDPELVRRIDAVVAGDLEAFGYRR